MDLSAILADIQVGDNWWYGWDIWPGVYGWPWLRSILGYIWYKCGFYPHLGSTQGLADAWMHPAQG